ncbi:MAG: agmatine deiminase family protein [Pirellulaceae bacterium]
MNTTSPHVWPAEWARQAATWIAWPHNLETWPGRFQSIPSVYVRFISTLASVQPVHVLSGGPAASPPAASRLANIANVTIHEIPTDDTWIRDYGPTFVKRKSDKELVGIDWKFNAWGGKYPPFDLDAAAAEAVCRKAGCTRSMSSMYCEGGALEGDGQGTLLTTSSCLLSPTRNPGWSREMVEDELKRQLGVSVIVWVDGGGLAGDDTDGHIDQLARFVAPGVVVAAVSSNINDPNHDGLLRNVRILRQSKDVAGQPLQVVELPTPPPRFIDGKRVPESYCNFLFANGIVIVPTFGNSETDKAAIEILASLIPARTIVPLDSSELIWGLGSFHCASQQQPA